MFELFNSVERYLLMGYNMGGGIMQTVSSHYLFFQRCKNREQYYALPTVLGKKKDRLLTTSVTNVELAAPGQGRSGEGRI